METVTDLIFLGSKLTGDMTAAMKLKDASSLEEKLDSVLKSRDITLPTKVRIAKGIVFPEVMYGCESWTIKKAERQRIVGFEPVVLEKTLDDPLDYQEIKPVNPKENQP